ncbi:MAG: hypothetical protein A2504_05155 [Bdellovibrionales bacterium RIFOXYD12_FULL_39_22]|nr:MAG: hypothetical protein A2385_06670 [Bdellovibrionales bacterium RIFOXYB1_FULL_39_21]OFZ41955.1 MAG: hypothetical protein A2485_08640 [Bdellovibrionales bacterium RIFOXYC12_FULL_39_17]OFZ50671.1 MAG: hypothetical protein A2404_05590 [Bdellovibrionales bacterium RIFOXYC1_FULL_39_130]OFZ74043.1 MAG: hypothetical protein A2451_16965 [Bdellovibrionales bacterium RIFOXYC2_FULL_39_8]OFZ77894.1 MAG: hypothetical protein A2560_00760 [Bdellovibrionales bacterium RIFOXYD1_FULL_39_84]OFZ93670.1 MAG:
METIPSLYIDTSNSLTIGLLDAQFKWIDYLSLEEKKSSRKIHALIYKMVKKNKVNLAQIDSLIVTAGPGSYTGIRVAEGIAQICEWQKWNTYSFYHFEVPWMVKKENCKMAWLALAFKGEIFIYYQDQAGVFVRELFSKDDYSDRINALLAEGHELYANNPAELPGLPAYTLLDSSKLIFDFPAEIFGAVVAKQMRHPPYYFRSLAKEFSVAKTALMP